MRVEMSWTVTASDLRRTLCCVCRKDFVCGVIQADLVSDSDQLHVGEVCPACLERGADYIERTIRFELRMSSTMAERQARMERRASEECLEVCPSFHEYGIFEAGCGAPRYATDEEAQAAWERGEW